VSIIHTPPLVLIKILKDFYRLICISDNIMNNAINISAEKMYEDVKKHGDKYE
jgi:hypothetical protein